MKVRVRVEKKKPECVRETMEKLAEGVLSEEEKNSENAEFDFGPKCNSSIDYFDNIVEDGD